MAINIDYAPISAALSLANQAGLGQGRQIQAQNTFQEQGIQNQQQQIANEAYAHQIQSALQGQQIGNEHALALAQLDAAKSYREQEMQYHNDSLKSLNNYRDNNLDVRQQQVANQADYRGQSLGIRQQLADTAQQRADQAPQQNHEQQQLESEYSRLTKQEAVTSKQVADFSFGDDTIFKDPIAQASQSVKGAKMGFEARFQDATNTLSRIQQRKQQIEAALKQRVDPLLQQGNPPALSAPGSQPPTQDQGQPSAPTQPRMDEVLVNPTTGQRIRRDATGQWVPA